ncbi:MAG TPA: hypothetical protein VK966_10060, partial [Longimicrobiales bacterium]|nr:hypothetical protein [Longimicrobiales bacterium]
SYMAEDRVTYSVSREALSLITSDRNLAYTPGPTERLMIPYVAALNYLKAGDPDGAAVEARRIEALLDQAGEDHEEARDGRHQFFHYLAGTIFEAAGDHSAADVAYRRSGPPGESGATAPEPEPAEARGDSMGDVIVLVEQGFVPHRVEQSVVIVIPPRQVRMLTEGSAGEKAAAAADAAARILLTASAVYGDRSGYYRDRGYRSPLHLDPWADDCRRGRCEDDEDDGDRSDPYLLRLSWPVLHQGSAQESVPRIRVGDMGVDAIARLDLATAARRDFNDERPTTLARMVLRAAAKLTLSHSLGQAVGDSNETAGQVAGLLTNLGTLLTERADTRAWHLLPGSISLARLRLPAGTHDLRLQMDGASGEAVNLGSVNVRPGTVTFLSTRLWN